MMRIVMTLCAGAVSLAVVKYWEDWQPGVGGRRPTLPFLVAFYATIDALLLWFLVWQWPNLKIL